MLFISICIISLCGAVTDAHSITKRDQVSRLVLHCTPQWNATDQSFTVFIDFNVSNEIIGILHSFIISFEVLLKSNQNTQSHVDVVQLYPNSGSTRANVTQFSYIDYDRHAINNDLIARYRVTTSWTDFPPGNDVSFRDDTLSLYPPSPPTPVDPSLTNSVYNTQHTAGSFIVTISSLTVSWSIDDDNNNNQLINYYLRFTGSFISQHSPSIISNVTAEGNNTFTGQSTIPITIYVHNHSPFILIQMYSEYSVTGNNDQIITVTSNTTNIRNISLTTSTSTISTPTSTSIISTTMSTSIINTTMSTSIINTPMSTSIISTTMSTSIISTTMSTSTGSTLMSTTIEPTTTPTSTSTIISTTIEPTASATSVTTMIQSLSVTVEASSVISSNQVTESVKGNTTTNGSSSFAQETTVIIVTSLLFVLFLVIGVVLVAFCWFTINRRRFKNISEGFDIEERNDDVFAIFNNQQQTVLLTGHSSNCNVDLTFSLHTDEWEIPFDMIEFDHLLGEGCFGEVYLGRLKQEFTSTVLTAYFRQDNTNGFVAIKLLKPTASSSEKNDFLKEIELMKKISVGKNPRVVNMLGSVTIQEPMLLVTEFVVHGDLLTFLRACRKKIVFHRGKGLHNEDTFDEQSGVLDSNDLVSFAYQITSGMEYLASLQVVHRDLACRNILVGEGKSLKITDFGMSRMIYHDSAYVKTTKGKLPLKWMSIESIIDRIFTTASDVWSFGICLWEIATLGNVPYPTVSNEDLLPMLNQGYRMEKPNSCSDEIYQIMLSCWEALPDERPLFSELRSNFDRILSRQRNFNENYIDLSDTSTLAAPIPSIDGASIVEKEEPVKEMKEKERVLSNSRLSNVYVESPSHSYDFKTERPTRLSFQGDTLSPTAAATPGGISLPINNESKSWNVTFGSHLDVSPTGSNYM